MTTQTTNTTIPIYTPRENPFFTITVKLISIQFEKPYVSITEEDALMLESKGIVVKRVVSERFGPSCQVSLKIAPDFMRKSGSINRPDLKIGHSYEVFINPYKFVYQGKSGISLQSNFMEDLGRVGLI